MAYISKAEREAKVLDKIRELVGAKETYKLRKHMQDEAAVANAKKRKIRNYLKGRDSDSESSGSDDDWTPEREAASLLRALSDLRKQQDEISRVRADPPTAEAFAALKAWMGAEFAPTWDKLDLAGGTAEGSALVARQPIAENEAFLFVPRERMLAYEDVLRSPVLGPLCRSDKLLQHMPEIVLTLALLVEACDAQSPWQAYVRCLPASFTTPLYYSRHDFAALAGSPALEESVQFLKQAMRVYAYLKPLAAQFNLCGGRFSWENFAWASSAVTSRQNPLPVALPDGRAATQLALIPVWDMCNHEPSGEVTSFFDVQRNGCEARALRAFGPGEAIYMNYGPRSNAKLLVYAGFAVRDNPYDAFALKLAVPPASEDPLAPVRNGMLAKHGMASECKFNLNRTSLDGAALLFARVLCLNKEEIKSYASLFTGGRVSPRNDTAAADLLEAAIREALAAVPDVSAEHLAAAAGSLQRSMLYVHMGDRITLERNLELLAAQREAWQAAAEEKRARKAARKAGAAGADAGAGGAAAGGAGADAGAGGATEDA